MVLPKFNVGLAVVAAKSGDEGLPPLAPEPFVRRIPLSAWGVIFKTVGFDLNGRVDVSRRWC